MLKNIPGKYKSAFDKFRCGVAPLKIETEKYEGILTENRLCFNNTCHMNNCIEDEKHVLLYCSVYTLSIFYCHTKQDKWIRHKF